MQDTEQDTGTRWCAHCLTKLEDGAACDCAAAQVDALRQAERERDLLAETAQRLTAEREIDREHIRMLARRIGTLQDAADGGVAEVRRLTAELDGERRAAAAAARDLETFGAALRPIVGLWYKYERLWNAGHVPAMQKAMAAARDLIGEGQS